MKLLGPNSEEMHMAQAIWGTCAAKEIPQNSLMTAEVNLVTKFLGDLPNYYLTDQDIEFASRVIMKEVYNALSETKGEVTYTDLEKFFLISLLNQVDKPNISEEEKSRVLHIGNDLLPLFKEKGISEIYYWNGDQRNYRYESLKKEEDEDYFTSIVRKANNGDVDSMVEVGLNFMREEKNETAKMWLEKAAEYDSPLAYVNLGIIYLKEFTDPNTAAGWLSKAVNSNNFECREKAKELIDEYLQPKFFGGWKFK